MGRLRFLLFYLVTRLAARQATFLTAELALATLLRPKNEAGKGAIGPGPVYGGQVSLIKCFSEAAQVHRQCCLSWKGYPKSTSTADLEE